MRIRITYFDVYVKYTIDVIHSSLHPIIAISNLIEYIY